MTGRPRLFVLVLILAGLGSLAVLLPFSRAASRPPGQVSASRCPGNGGGLSVVLFSRPQKLVSDTDIPVCVRGGLTVAFAGDPSTGCAAAGLCAYSGTESWRPQGVGDAAVATSVLHGRRSSMATLILGNPGTPGVSVVERSVAGGPAAPCRDHAQSQGGFFSLPIQRGQVDIGLGHADPPLLGTRCAGPLDSDVAAALPHRSVSLRRLERGRLTIDLSAAAPFAAHGFSGTLRSTIVLILGRPRRTAQPQHMTAPPGLTPTRFTSVTYRITRLVGSLSAAVDGSGLSAACARLDACGVHGTVTVAPQPAFTGTAGLVATAPARRPRRDLLTALGLATGGRSAGVSVDGGGDARTPGTVTAALGGPGGPCTDQVRLFGTAIELGKHAGRLVVSVLPERSQAADPLRTRCPGPALANHMLTSTSLPLSVLHRPDFTVHLHGRTFREGPYSVSARSSLVLTLRRGAVRTQVVPFLARR